MITKEQKDLIHKYSKEGKTNREISNLLNISIGSVYYQLNQTKEALIASGKWEEHKIKKKIYDKSYRIENKEKRKIQNKLYWSSRIEEKREYNRNYEEKRKKEDIQFKLKKLLRSRVKNALNGKNHSDYIELLGCTLEQYKQYLESQFRDGMSWDNQGKVWQIDHIIPCVAFDLSVPEQQKECFNYKNTQPLLVEENLSKSDTMPDGTKARKFKTSI